MKVLLEKVENKNKKPQENDEYIRVQIEVDEKLQTEYAEHLEDGKYVSLLFTEHQINEALERAAKNPEDLKHIQTSIWDKLFG